MDVYTGSCRLFESVRKRSARLSFSFIGFTEENKIREAIIMSMLLAETPSSPLLKVVYLER